MAQSIGRPSGKPKPSNYPFGQSGGTEMTASGKGKNVKKNLKRKEVKNNYGESNR